MLPHDPLSSLLIGFMGGACYVVVVFVGSYWIYGKILKGD